ncbi:MAG TPA: PhzF family phenazine biosynthesis protein [Pyrinomonadaceae bacterium]|nr:PhzF family phenazine biosynthesis protein [Pyrinomonadaceae bacterium]
MRQYDFLQLDVFTERVFSGNPLAVFPEAEGLADEEMQKIAREMNLSETVFVLPPRDDVSLKRLRIFTPMIELPMAGHPVVGTWNALARAGVVPVPEGGSGWTRIHQELGVGVLPVDIEFKDEEPIQVVMTQGAFQTHNEVDDMGERAEIERALGLAPEDLDESLPIEVVSTGLPILVVPVRSLAAMGRIRMNATLLSDAYTRAGASLCYAFTRETREGNPSAAHARSFVPDLGIPEDPATGGAAGPLAAYLVKHGALNAEADAEGMFRFRIEQGDFMERPSRINAEVRRGEDAAIEEVRVGGASVMILRGSLMF